MRKNKKRILDRQLLCVSFAGGSEGNESTGNAGLIPGSGRSLGDVNDNPLQYSCLENPMDRRTWWGLQSMGFQRVKHDLVIESESCSVLSDSLRPHRLYSQSVEFSRPEYWSG